MLFLPLHRRVNERPAVAVWSLIAVTVAAFLVFSWSAQGPTGLQALWTRFGYVPAQPELSSLVTHLFLHAGWEHLAGNLLMLALMGMNVERRLGPGVFLALYFLSGFAAASLFGAFNPRSTLPLGGASGAISGVAGAYLVLFARREVDVFWFLLVTAGTLRLPAWTFTLFWAALEIFQALLLNGRTNVANWAHVGGFAAGLGGVILLRSLGFHGVPEKADRPTGVRKPPDRFDDLAYVPELAEPRYVAVARRFEAPPGANPSALGPPLPLSAARKELAHLEAQGFHAFLVDVAHAAALPPLRRAVAATIHGDGLSIVDEFGRTWRCDFDRIYLATASLDAKGRAVADVLATSPWTAFRFTGDAATSTARLLADRSAASPELRDHKVHASLSAHDERTLWLLRVKVDGSLKTEP